MRHNSSLAIGILLGSCLAAMGSVPAEAAPQVGSPAVWAHHDLIIDLHDLPTRYSCDDLWYKFRDVLLAVGARPDIQILVYHCTGKPGSPPRAPSVHLRFSTPELVRGAQARWADLEAAPETVRLSPGNPASLRASDCELMRQIKDGLLAQLAERIVRVDLSCETPGPTRWPFNVTVQTLAPVYATPHVAARVVGSSPGRAR